MPGKYESMVALAAEEARGITANGDAYMSFLTTAANNFKYTFREQLLIHAQKPDATACAEIKFWNQHGRWVNRGTHGIALLVDTNTPYKLRYVFDLSDTNSRAGREIALWHMEERYEATVKEALADRFGPCDTEQDLPSFLIDLADMVAEDNITDYLDSLNEVRQGSLLEELDSDSARVWLKTALKNSVAYMLLTRCGLDAGAHFSSVDFQQVYDFNTVETISVLGAAASDISEMALREIAITVRALQREEKHQIHTFASPTPISYDEVKPANQERRIDDETDVQDRRGLSASQSGGAGGAEGGQVRDAAEDLPSGEQAGDLHGDAPVRETEPTPGGGRSAGQRDDGTADHSDGPVRGRDREPEGDGPDEMGSLDEQYPAKSGRKRTGRTDLQLIPSFLLDNKGIPYYYLDAEKQELLRTSLALKKHRVEIASFFDTYKGRQERGDFIRSFFDNTYVEIILESGQRAGYRAFAERLILWRGSYPKREMEVIVPWPQVADTIYGMMLTGQWFAPDKRPLPTVAEQLSLLDEIQAEKETAFVLPQAAIDYVLVGGSGVSQGKYRIYEQFKKQEGQKPISAF